jgi:2-keto-4-pentenoate hydratase
VGEGERIGPGPVIGHLTSATQLEPGAVYRAEAAVDLRADAEVALRLGADVGPQADREAAAHAIAAYGTALELVDLGMPPPGDPERIIATNIWHRAFTLGPLDRPPPHAAAEGRLLVEGELRGSSPISQDFAELVGAVARLLGAAGERLQDRRPPDNAAPSCRSQSSQATR